MAEARCSLQAGCDETGVCYAQAHGQPEQCPRSSPCEDHPCGLCDSDGRCTFACEYAESVPPPDYRAMLVLAEKVLDDLSEPDPALRKLEAIRAACARLRDEIRSTLGLPRKGSALDHLRTWRDAATAEALKEIARLSAPSTTTPYEQER